LVFPYDAEGEKEDSMIKKLLPFLLLALMFVAPTSFAADPNDHQILKDPMWTGLIPPERLGLRLLPDLQDEAVRVETGWPVTINLTTVDMSSMHLDQTTITFSADLKGDFTGNAYLEMWLHVPGGMGGNFQRKSLERPLQGKAPWSRFQTSFTLSKGQVPEKAYLNLVINGRGRVWFRNIQLTHSP
jgi:hypothetical protein